MQLQLSRLKTDKPFIREMPQTEQWPRRRVFDCSKVHFRMV